MHAQLTASEQVEPPPPPVLSASEIDTASAVAVVDISSDPSAQQNGPAMNQYLSRRRSATVSHRSATDILGDGILKSLSGDAATSNAHVIAFGREAAGIKARTQMRAISVPMAMLAVIGVFCQVSFWGGSFCCCPFLPLSIGIDAYLLCFMRFLWLCIFTLAVALTFSTNISSTLVADPSHSTGNSQRNLLPTRFVALRV